MRQRVEDFIFRRRPLVIAFFTAITLFMAYETTRLRIDASFDKLLPLQHEYMKTFVQYRQEFGGANRILIALIARDGDMFTPRFFEALKSATDEVFFLPGVDRAQVRSLFTPNVRFTEVVEDGIAAGNVIPADFAPTPEGLARVRENILKAGIVGRLVANDFSGALISAQLLDFDPSTGEPLDTIAFARQLEERVRGKVDTDDSAVDIHIIGFAKVIGDIADGATRVVFFFAVTVLITALFLYAYSSSFRLTITVLGCSLVAVVWQLGLLGILGYGIDPLGILVPFLVFAIAVSHGVQMISAVRAELLKRVDALTATREGCHALILPGIIALSSDTLGFVAIRWIKIRVIQEMAVAAGLGVAAIILTNLVLLPVLVSYMRVDDAYKDKLQKRVWQTMRIWRPLSRAAEPRPASIIIGISVVLAVLGGWIGSRVSIGDLHEGVPELRPDSRYNRDSRAITEKFSIGVDLLSVIAETVEEGCIDHEVMTTIDDFAWHVRNMEGVQTVVSLPAIAKVINAGWNEGSLEWRVIPRSRSLLAQSVAYVPTSSGLLNETCSVMPVMVFTADHKAETIGGIVSGIKEYGEGHPSDKVRFRLASGNVGVMAATNEEVESDQFPILISVFGAVIVLCAAGFRSFRALICIVVPLGIVSLLAYALMTLLEIGLKVSTLPVVALGVGIGVDYGIYIFSRLRSFLDEGQTLQDAYRLTLIVAGNGVVFTGITLAVGVGAWIFSPLQFQADMGILLTFMFLVNMLGAILLLPALATWLFTSKRAGGGSGT